MSKDELPERLLDWGRVSGGGAWGQGVPAPVTVTAGGPQTPRGTGEDGGPLADGVCAAPSWSRRPGPQTRGSQTDGTRHVSPAQVKRSLA